MVCLIADVQGFQVGTLFVPKELCVIDADSGWRMSHHIFREPYPMVELTDEQRKSVLWVTNNYHGLSWDGVGHSLLGDIQDILDTATYNADTILCKGEVKKKFLEKYVGGRCQIIDLGTTTPSLHSLQLKASCSNHNYESCHCAMTNAFFIYNHLKFNQVQ